MTTTTTIITTSSAKTTTTTTTTPWLKRQRALVEATKTTAPLQGALPQRGNSKLLDGVEFSSEEATALENDRLAEEAREPATSLRGEQEEDTLVATTFLDSWIPQVITDENVGVVAMFNDIWHELESGPVRMLTNESDNVGMVAMFREVGAAAVAEYHAGRRVLTTATLRQMKWALQQARQLWNTSGLPLLLSLSSTTAAAAETLEDKHRNMFLAETMFEI